MLSEHHAVCLGTRKGILRALGYQRPFLFGERRIQVQHERVGIDAQLGNNKRDALCHQAGDKGNITRKPIELCHDDRSLDLARILEGGFQNRAPVERIGSLAGFDFHMLGDNLEAFRLGEPCNRFALRFKAQAGTSLLCGRDADISDGRFHGISPCVYTHIRTFACVHKRERSKIVQNRGHIIPIGKSPKNNTMALLAMESGVGTASCPGHKSYRQADHAPCRFGKPYPQPHLSEGRW